jgi:hypothetical protein
MWLKGSSATPKRAILPLEGPICNRDIYRTNPNFVFRTINIIMSLRRKSCDACFQGRRKCDLNFPVCTRCQKNQKICHYIRSPPVPKERDALDVSASALNWALDGTSRNPEQLRQDEDDTWDPAFNFDLQQSDLIGGFLPFSLPSFLGNLGELQPVSGSTRSWEWVIEQLKSYPQSFAQCSETTFIHKELYRNQLPPSIRTAFGVCSAHTCTNNGIGSMMFQILNAEAGELLMPPANVTLLEALSRMQAMVLYQIIRIYHGDLKQRILAERQESSVVALGLQLLHRADIELREEQATWENWILAESIRRTVMVTFMLYAIYSIFKHGICAAYPTLSVLPVSTTQGIWNSPRTDMQHRSLGQTNKYLEYTNDWVAMPQAHPEPFEKMLLVACKGIDQVEALAFSAIVM